MNKICPLMSNGDKIVNCTENCAWYDPKGQITRKCAIFRVVDSIDYLSGSDIVLNQDSASNDG